MIDSDKDNLPFEEEQANQLTTQLVTALENLDPNAKDILPSAFLQAEKNDYLDSFVELMTTSIGIEAGNRIENWGDKPTPTSEFLNNPTYNQVLANAISLGDWQLIMETLMREYQRIEIKRNPQTNLNFTQDTQKMFQLHTLLTLACLAAAYSLDK